MINLTTFILIVVLGVLVSYVGVQRNKASQQDESDPVTRRAPVWECPQGKATRWKELLRQMDRMNPPKIVPKIVLFVSHNHTQLPTYARLAVQSYRMYARQFDNVEFIEMKHDVADSAISPYWLRVCDFQRLMSRYPEGTIIGYMDLDTMIRPEFFNIPVHVILSAIDRSVHWAYDVYIGCCPFQNDKNYLNSGVIFARNTQWSRTFFNLWLNRYPAESWIKHPRTHKWICRRNGRVPCSWAGDAYEQGVLNSMWAEDVMSVTQHLCRVHRSVFSEVDLDKTSFMVHLMRGGNDYREQVFKNFLLQHEQE